MIDDLRSANPPQNRDAAITGLFLAHHSRLVGLARLLVDDLPTAEDVVQEAFTMLYRRWPWLRDKAAALSYLQACVVNRSRSNLRRRRTARRAVLPVPEPAPSAERFILDADEQSAVRTALAGLPDRQRQVIVLRYYLDWTETEIADALTISRGSVKQHTSRAMSRLSVQLGAIR